MVEPGGRRTFGDEAIRHRIQELSGGLQTPRRGSIHGALGGSVKGECSRGALGGSAKGEGGCLGGTCGHQWGQVSFYTESSAGTSPSATSRPAAKPLHIHVPADAGTTPSLMFPRGGDDAEKKQGLCLVSSMAIYP